MTVIGNTGVGDIFIYDSYTDVPYSGVPYTVGYTIGLSPTPLSPIMVKHGRYRKQVTYNGQKWPL